MIGSLWANSNYDDDKGTRKQAIEELEANFEVAVQKMLGVYVEEEIDMDNPFFASVVKGKEMIDTPQNIDGTVAEVIDSSEYSKYIDQ